MEMASRIYFLQTISEVRSPCYGSPSSELASNTACTAEYWSIASGAMYGRQLMPFHSPALCNVCHVAPALAMAVARPARKHFRVYASARGLPNNVRYLRRSRKKLLAVPRYSGVPAVGFTFSTHAEKAAHHAHHLRARRTNASPAQRRPTRPMLAAAEAYHQRILTSTTAECRPRGSSSSSDSSPNSNGIISPCTLKRNSHEKKLSARGHVSSARFDAKWITS